jgi:pentatricopeptide repeat protein
LRVGNVLIHMYAKSGSIDDAQLVYDRMEKCNEITWNAMIGGLAQHGCGLEALEKLRNMIGDGVKPDELSLVAILSACSHAGLWMMVVNYFWPCRKTMASSLILFYVTTWWIFLGGQDIWRKLCYSFVTC